MRQKIPVSKARTQLSCLLKQLQGNPDTVFEITVNSMVLGELRAPEAAQFRVKPGKSLLEAVEDMGKPEIPAPENSSVAREHDRYLYRKGA
jgi:hypothetical protein